MAKKRVSESFGKLRKKNRVVSEDFGNVPNVSEKTSEHILTVREVAKMFENKGVSRTERSIVNWCHPNKQGITRLDCYLDPNENKYYITRISVDRAIQEEQNKLKIKDQNNVSESQQKFSEPFGNASESFGKNTNIFGKLPNLSEVNHSEDLNQQLKELEMKNRDLQITNKAKDIYIDRLEKNQDNFIKELTSQSRRIGELETKLLQLNAPQEEPKQNYETVNADEKSDYKEVEQDSNNQRS